MDGPKASKSNVFLKENQYKLPFRLSETTKSTSKSRSRLYLVNSCYRLVTNTTFSIHQNKIIKMESATLPRAPNQPVTLYIICTNIYSVYIYICIYIHTRISLFPWNCCSKLGKIWIIHDHSTAAKAWSPAPARADCKTAPCWAKRCSVKSVECFRSKCRFHHRIVELWCLSNVIFTTCKLDGRVSKDMSNAFVQRVPTRLLDILKYTYHGSHKSQIVTKW